EVGNLPTLAENRSHFALWAMLASPLIIGTDVPAMKPEIRDVLANPRLIAINQDRLGVPAMRWIATPELDVWAKPLDGGRWAVALLNRGDSERTGRIDWAAFAEMKDDLKGYRADFARQAFRLTDAWTGRAAGTTAAPLERTLGPRDTLVFTLDPA